jgi:hypothetical protein
MGTSEQPPDLAQIADRIGAVASEAASVAIGLGILGINRIQVLRRQLIARIGDATSVARPDHSDE